MTHNALDGDIDDAIRGGEQIGGSEGGGEGVLFEEWLDEVRVRIFGVSDKREREREERIGGLWGCVGDQRRGVAREGDEGEGAESEGGQRRKERL